MGIKHLASRLSRKHGTNNPFTIASQKNIIVLFEPLGSVMGYFNTYKRIKMIHINSNFDENTQRYTCAHELGHSILHPKVNTPFLKANTLQCIDRIEREANQFAVELLISDKLLLEGMTVFEAAVASGVPEEVAHLKRKPDLKRNFWSDDDSYISF